MLSSKALASKFLGRKHSKHDTAYQALIRVFDCVITKQDIVDVRDALSRVIAEDDAARATVVVGRYPTIPDDELMACGN